MREFGKIQELDGSQIELVAGRVSALNECFYRTNSHALMLHASISYSGRDAHLQGISQGAVAGDTGSAHGERLTTFASAAVAGDVADLATARGALRDAAGSGALVAPAAVVGNFQGMVRVGMVRVGMVRIGMVRIAAGAGIPLDGVTLALTSGLREDLGVEEYSSRRLGGSGGIVRAIGPVLRGLASLELRLAGRRSRRKSGQ